MCVIYATEMRLLQLAGLSVVTCPITWYAQQIEISGAYPHANTITLSFVRRCDDAIRQDSIAWNCLRHRMTIESGRQNHTTPHKHMCLYEGRLISLPLALCESGELNAVR